jgi:hypothetical protein
MEAQVAKSSLRPTTDCSGRRCALPPKRCVRHRERGLEPRINDRARERTIAVHGARYVSPELAPSRRPERTLGERRRGDHRRSLNAPPRTAAHSFGRRMIRIGRRLRAMAARATEPRTTRAKPVRPYEAITTASAVNRSAS